MCARYNRENLSCVKDHVLPLDNTTYLYKIVLTQCDDFHSFPVINGLLIYNLSAK